MRLVRLYLWGPVAPPLAADAMALATRGLHGSGL